MGKNTRFEQSKRKITIQSVKSHSSSTQRSLRHCHSSLIVGVWIATRDTARTHTKQQDNHYTNSTQNNGPRSVRHPTNDCVRYNHDDDDVSCRLGKHDFHGGGLFRAHLASDKFHTIHHRNNKEVQKLGSLSITTADPLLLRVSGDLIILQQRLEQRLFLVFPAVVCRSGYQGWCRRLVHSLVCPALGRVQCRGGRQSQHGSTRGRTIRWCGLYRLDYRGLGQHVYFSRRQQGHDLCTYLSINPSIYQNQNQTPLAVECMDLCVCPSPKKEQGPFVGAWTGVYYCVPLCLGELERSMSALWMCVYSVSMEWCRWVLCVSN